MTKKHMKLRKAVIEILSDGDCLSTTQIWDALYDDYPSLRRQMPVPSTLATILRRTPAINYVGQDYDYYKGDASRLRLMNFFELKVE